MSEVPEITEAPSINRRITAQVDPEKAYFEEDKKFKAKMEKLREENREAVGALKSSIEAIKGPLVGNGNIPEELKEAIKATLNND